MTDLSISLIHEAPADGPAIDKLHERAFGPGRFARTAYRLREGIPAEPSLSFTAMVGTLLVGSIRLTLIRIGPVGGLLLGPVTVEPAFMNRGIGMALIRKSLDAARAEGHRLVLLVGDEPYYRRSGFKRVPNGRLEMPGPVDPARLLVLELVEGAFEGVSGAVLPRLAASAA
jgi:predicted N-acetyltransferase YhbS